MFSLETFFIIIIIIIIKKVSKESTEIPGMKGHEASEEEFGAGSLILRVFRVERSSAA